MNNNKTSRNTIYLVVPIIFSLYYMLASHWYATNTFFLVTDRYVSGCNYNTCTIVKYFRYMG